MKIKHTLILLLAAGLIFSLSLELKAQDKEETLLGSFMLGYRAVDTSGAYSKYKEDFNLAEGVRLFNFNLSYTPSGKYSELFDRLDINAYNLGGDPYETLGISAQKYGKYKLQYNRKKSDYFYADMQEIEGGHLYDMHTYDYERIQDSAAAKFSVNKNLDVYVNFDRFSKTGNSVTTLDLNRIEFEFDKPVQEESKELAVGVDIHLNRASFLYEKKLLDYENSNSFFLPGFADGGPGARYPSSLELYMLNQPYELKSHNNTFKFNTRPLDILLITGSAMIIDQKMDLEYSEESSGTTYLNRLFASNQSGSGSFDRRFQLYDVDATLLLTNKLAIISAFRYNDFEQAGTFTIEQTAESSEWNYNTMAYEGGLQYQFFPNFALTAGYRHEIRELETTETATYEDETTRQGFFGNLKWDIGKSLKMTADYQRGSYDDPYTLVSPTEYHRLRFTARLNMNNVNFTGSYLNSKTESEVFDDMWESAKDQINLRLGYHGEKITLTGGYAFINIKHEADRMIAYPPGYSGAAGTFPWEIFYEGKSGLWDASAAYRFNENWAVSSYINSYSNSGFWEISRLMIKAYVEHVFNAGYVARLGYRYIDFEEADSGLNNYNAKIVEFSFGYRWK